MFDWQLILDKSKANLPANSPIPGEHQNITKNDDQSFVIPLTQYAIITVDGADALKFLQGQTTCDFNRLNSEPFILGAHCNPKGRIISNFVATKKDDQIYHLKIHTSNIEHALECLKKYSVFFKLNISISSTLGCLAILHGDELFATNKTQTQKHRSNQQPKQIIIEIAPGLTEIWAESIILQQLLFSENHVVSTKTQYELFTTTQGLADITSDLSEKLLPHEINYQLIDAISFTKGCYTGQEVIARMHYKAQLKKHMYLAEFTHTESLTIGDTLLDSKMKPVGLLIKKVSLHGITKALLLCKDEYLTDNQFHIGTEKLDNFQWISLPYAIPN